MADNVNNPPHYNQHGIECIEAIEASMSKEEYQGYLKGNTIKYLWRYKYKGHARQDIEKARWYLDRLLGTLIEGQVTRLAEHLAGEEMLVGETFSFETEQNHEFYSDPPERTCEIDGHEFDIAAGDTKYQCVHCGALPKIAKADCLHDWMELVLGDETYEYCRKCGVKEKTNNG